MRERGTLSAHRHEMHFHVDNISVNRHKETKGLCPAFHGKAADKSNNLFTRFRKAHTETFYLFNTETSFHVLKVANHTIPKQAVIDRLFLFINNIFNYIR